MKRLFTIPRGIIIHICFLLLFSLGSYSSLAQVTVAFQGGEPGDTWGYTTNGLGAAVASECASAPNIKIGTRSIGVGGNAGGGNCWLGGSGNGPNSAHTITLNSINISTSSAYTRTLSFSWGNRFPGCNGTGWDSGENLTFRAYHDGVAQALVTIVNGANNAGYSIQSNSYTWTIPPCVQDFYFVLSITTNRSDELLFMDDARIEAPALNPTINQPSAVMGNTTICQGTAATYSVTNVPGTSYTWSNLPVGASFTSANNSVNSHSIAINWGTAAPGTYSVLVTRSDACGIAPGTAQTVAISVLPPPAPLSITGPTVLCQGDVITLTSSYASNNTWSTGATTSNASVTPNGPLSFCQGNSLILTSAMSSGNSWSTGESTPSITVTTTGVYSLTVTTVCGTAVSSTSVNVTPSTITPSITASGPTSFCQGGSVILSSGSGTGNNWSTGATTPTIMVNTAGVYTLTVSNACASASLTQSISTIPITTASITPLGPITFCQGGSVVLVSNAVNGNSWSTGAVSPSISVNTAGIYTLTVAAACGTTSATQQITVNPLPTAVISVTGSTALCPGSSAILTVSGGTPYNWSTGQTGTSITVTNPGTYTASSANGCGTVVSLPVTITALALPTVQVTGGGIICAGDSSLLTASGGPGFSWSNGSAAPSIYVHSSGTYVVSSANSCGTATASARVDLVTMDATFNSNVVNGNAPLPVQFSNTSSGNLTHVQWNFGHDGSSNESSPSHVFQNAGVYTVSLTVQNGNGCADSYTLNITVRSEVSTIRVPNVFTPNHDKVNDEFTIDTEGISDFRMSIFDRWGRLVMETSDPAKGWDGSTNSGTEAADGTYYYMIIAKGTDDKTYNEKGTVNLFR